MPDALGVAQLDRFTDVEGEVHGWNRTGSELARVQRNVDSRIETVAVVDDLHTEVVFDQRAVHVFGAQDADDPANLHAATGLSLGRAAMLDGVALGLDPVHTLARLCDSRVDGR